MMRKMINNSRGEIDKAGLVPRVRGKDELEALKIRRHWLEKVTDQELDELGYADHHASLITTNIEHAIGHVQVPVGVAGPLEIHGHHVDGTYYIPLATTEAALVKSYERGAVALSRCGGARTSVLDRRIHISPVIKLSSAPEAIEIVHWIEENLSEISQCAQGDSQHTNLLNIQTRVVGRLLFLTCYFDTGDASGLNMINAAIYRICDLLTYVFPDAEIRSRSNLSSDKKAAQIHNHLGYGHRVTAECFLNRTVLKRYLKTTPEDIFETWRLSTVGSIQAGAMGFNAHVTNGLSALFIATGQDVAQLANCSNAITTIEVEDDGMYISVTLPSLVIATVGGGTSLPSQQTNLKLLNCVGPGSVNRLAEIIGATALAGELSLGAALYTNDHRQAHASANRKSRLKIISRD